tara:strand:+ start:797 stop:955 length:159 start_codon:yes stop_codon:yes gene_type:complete
MSDIEINLLEAILEELKSLNASVKRIDSFILEVSPAEAEKEIKELEKELRSI